MALLTIHKNMSKINGKPSPNHPPKLLSGYVSTTGDDEANDDDQ